MEAPGALERRLVEEQADHQMTQGGSTPPSHPPRAPTGAQPSFHAAPYPGRSGLSGREALGHPRQDARLDLRLR